MGIDTRDQAQAPNNAAFMAAQKTAKTLRIDVTSAVITLYRASRDAPLHRRESREARP